MPISALSYHPRSSCVRWPDDDVARVQQTKDYRYAVADLVSPVTRYVVGIFVDDVQAPKAGEGRRTP